MTGSKVDFTAAGGNRDPAAADWFYSDVANFIAYGAGRNVALWNAASKRQTSNRLTLLKGHGDDVKAVKFLPQQDERFCVLLSGSADRTIRVWSAKAPISDSYFEERSVLRAHSGSVHCIQTAPGFDGFVSAAADGTVNIWTLRRSEENSGELICSLVDELRPNFIPLALSLARLDSLSFVLAVAGTKSKIAIYVSESQSSNPSAEAPLGNSIHFRQVATLIGHEGWIRSLSFHQEAQHTTGELLLASASQDKYIRLWRIRRREEVQTNGTSPSLEQLLSSTSSLSSKVYRFGTQHGQSYSITFDALLVGHEDWIYTVAWKIWNDKLQLLSTSADSSLCVWESDPSSDIWVSTARLGEVSAQKGATTATGSTGGFWVGLWSPDGSQVASLGRTGSWRLWDRADDGQTWIQMVAPTGHTGEVRDLVWSRRGDYLLTTGADQSTRQFAEWQKNDGVSWHEFSRAQIHGYDINCIDTISETVFISGADEKLLRIFDEPAVVAEILAKFCNIEKPGAAALPDAASLSVLGLSNKAIQETEKTESGREDDDRDTVAFSGAQQSFIESDQPPLEDHLSRHTLWPEKEKLYGHGYEISAVAASHDGSLVATACRASALQHAVIRLYDTKNWNEIKPALQAHSLTVHRVRFSPDDKYLLSVGRDRQWSVFERDDRAPNTYRQYTTGPKAHSRMIMDCSWAPLVEDPVFATAGRDKSTKVWKLRDSNAACTINIAATSAVTSVDFVASHLDFDILRSYILAYGTETGCVTACTIDVATFSMVMKLEIPAALSPASSITRLAWRPKHGSRAGAELRSLQLAVASDDNSVRIYSAPLTELAPNPVESVSGSGEFPTQK